MFVIALYLYVNDVTQIWCTKSMCVTAVTLRELSHFGRVLRHWFCASVLWHSLRKVEFYIFLTLTININLILKHSLSLTFTLRLTLTLVLNIILIITLTLTLMLILTLSLSQCIDHLQSAETVCFNTVVLLVTMCAIPKPYILAEKPWE